MTYRIPPIDHLRAAAAAVLQTLGFREKPDWENSPTTESLLESSLPHNDWLATLAGQLYTGVELTEAQKRKIRAAVHQTFTRRAEWRNSQEPEVWLECGKLFELIGDVIAAANCYGHAIKRHWTPAGGEAIEAAARLLALGFDVSEQSGLREVS